MNYFQILNKALEYYINEPLEKEIFEDWGIPVENEKDILDIKATAQKEQMYLFLRQLKKHFRLSDNYSNLYKYLSENLSSFFIDKTKTKEKALRVARKELKEDLFYADAKCVLDDEDSRANYSKSALKQLQDYVEKKELEGAKEYIANGNREKTIEFTAIENIIYDIVTILPELLFTKKGYRYIPKKYQIEDNELREDCYEYVKYNIGSFCWENKYMHDFKAIVYTMRLTNIVLLLVQHKKYKELDNLMEIDEYLKEKGDAFTSLVNIIYPVKNKRNIKLEENPFKNLEYYDALFFLLSDKQVQETFSNEQIAITLLYHLTDINNEGDIKSIFSNLTTSDVTIQQNKEMKKVKDSIHNNSQNIKE